MKMVFFCGLRAPQVLKGNRVHIVSSFVINKKERGWGNGAGEWEEEAENELKQEVGRTSLQTTAVFQVLAVKEGRKGESEEGLNSVRGQDKIQYAVTQVAILMSRIATFAVQGKCNRLSGSGVRVRGGFQVR